MWKAWTCVSYVAINVEEAFGKKNIYAKIILVNKRSLYKGCVKILVKFILTCFITNYIRKYLQRLIIPTN